MGGVQDFADFDLEKDGLIKTIMKIISLGYYDFPISIRIKKDKPWLTLERNEAAAWCEGVLLGLNENKRRLSEALKTVEGLLK